MKGLAVLEGTLWGDRPAVVVAISDRVVVIRTFGGYDREFRDEVSHQMPFRVHFVEPQSGAVELTARVRLVDRGRA